MTPLRQPGVRVDGSTSAQRGSRTESSPSSVLGGLGARASIFARRSTGERLRVAPYSASSSAV